MTATLDAADMRLLADAENDPILFAREFLDVDPTRQQRDFLCDLARPGAHVAVRSGHGTGKSTALAIAALWFLCMKDDALVPCTAPTAHQLQDILWREIKRLTLRMHPWMQGQIRITNDRVTLADSAGLIVARTARPETPDALQGFHAPNILFIIDEAPGVNEQIFQVARGALSTPNARVAMAGNPTRLTGFFHNAFHGARDSWTRLQFSCLDSPLVAPAYPQEIAQEYGEDSDMYRVRVLGDFPRSDINSLIPQELIRAAMERVLPLSYVIDREPSILGVDPAHMGSDRSAVVLRQGLSMRPLLAARGIDTLHLSTLVMQFAREYRADAVFVDGGGVGAGVCDQLLALGAPAHRVMFGGAALDSGRFINRRAEMWWKLREWLEKGGCLPKDATDFADDLGAPMFQYTPGAFKVQLESKDSMRKRGLASPDLADAGALTFAAPVVPRYVVEVNDHLDSVFDGDAYNPLSGSGHIYNPFK